MGLPVLRRALLIFEYLSSKSMIQHTLQTLKKVETKSWNQLLVSDYRFLVHLSCGLNPLLWQLSYFR